MKKITMTVLCASVFAIGSSNAMVEESTTEQKNPVSAITVDQKYNVPNGFSGIMRDLIFLLLKNMTDEDAKTKAIFGMCDEHFQWKDHPYFKWIRQSDSLKRRVWDFNREFEKGIEQLIQSGQQHHDSCLLKRVFIGKNQGSQKLYDAREVKRSDQNGRSIEEMTFAECLDICNSPGFVELSPFDRSVYLWRVYDDIVSHLYKFKEVTDVVSYLHEDEVARDIPRYVSVIVYIGSETITAAQYRKLPQPVFVLLFSSAIRRGLINIFSKEQLQSIPIVYFEKCALPDILAICFFNKNKFSAKQNEAICRAIREARDNGFGCIRRWLHLTPEQFEEIEKCRERRLTPERLKEIELFDGKMAFFREVSGLSFAHLITEEQCDVIQGTFWDWDFTLEQLEEIENTGSYNEAAHELYSKLKK
ncbi:hypothetical protein FACS1894122_03720 [Alphaproteobacteria bacterium]|nr:hypothetical protein FACS1894122_03720 [Alphaproteobacteria bacterium]